MSAWELPKGLEDWFSNELVAAKQGDLARLGSLLELYRRYLHEVAIRKLARDVAVKSAPSDIVQVTLFEAVSSFPQFDGSTDRELCMWLRQILEHNIIDEHRYFRNVAERDVSREVPLNDVCEEPGTFLGIDTVQTASSIVSATEDSQILAKAMQRLNPDDRRIIELRTFNNLPFTVIGKCLGRKTDAVRYLWTCALEKLAVELRRYDSNSVRPR